MPDGERSYWFFTNGVTGQARALDPLVERDSPALLLELFRRYTMGLTAHPLDVLRLATVDEMEREGWYVSTPTRRRD